MFINIQRVEYMKHINTVEAENNTKKYYAFLNARTTSAVYKTTFTDKAVLLMERASFMLSMLHFDSKYELNYRKTLAAIKVFNKNVKDKKQYREYIKHLRDMGFDIKVNDRLEIIYSIKKSVIEA